MRHISIDIETHDPHLIDKGPSWVYGDGEILTVGLYDVEKKRAGYIDGNGGEKVRELLLSASVALIGANIQYDFGWLCASHNIKVKDTQCSLICVQVAESFIDQYARYTLDALSYKYLGEKKKIDEVASFALSMGLKGDARKHLKTIWDKSDAGKKKIRKYVVSDATQPARIWEKQKKIMLKEGTYDAFLINMDMLKRTVKMKQTGVRIDYDKWVENCEKAKDIYDRLEKHFFDKWGKVNINSPKQLGEFMVRHNVPFKYCVTVRGFEPKNRKFVVKTDLFTGEEIAKQRAFLSIGFPGVRIEKDRIRMYVDRQYVERTVTQLEQLGYNVIMNPNLDKFFIQDYKNRYEVVNDLSEYKIVNGIISKFLGPNFGRFLIYHKDKKEWRIHGDFNVVGARQTGRLSSNNPNLQNIPSKTVVFAGTPYEVNLAVMCREIFLPEKGEVWVKLDYSGQENVLQAHFAVGKYGRKIRQMYRENPRFDEHQFVATASGLEVDFGNEIGRKYAKNVRFGISYGMQIPRMCIQFGWTKEFAEELYDKIKDASPWFIETMEAVVAKVLRVGFIITLLGRRIKYNKWRPGLNPRTAKAYPFYNYLIQGSAADQLKKAQTDCDKTQTVETPLLTVHDEGDESLPMTKKGFARLCEMKHLYEQALPLDVPIICDPEIGLSWAHLEGQKKWSRLDFEKGLCKKEDVNYPKETLEEFWNRVTIAIKDGSFTMVEEDKELPSYLMFEEEI